MLTLYDHTEALATVHEWLIEAGGELTPEIEELLEQAEGDFETKVERVALKIREMEATAEAVKSEADRLAARAKALKKGAESLKDGYLHVQMLKAGAQAVKRPLATVRVQNSPLSAVCAIPAERLAEFRNDCDYAPFIIEVPATYRFDAKAAIAAAKAGEVLPEGIYTEQRTHVRIY
jgi:hypothetical protein